MCAVQQVWGLGMCCKAPAILDKSENGGRGEKGVDPWNIMER